MMIHFESAVLVPRAPVLNIPDDDVAKMPTRGKTSVRDINKSFSLQKNLLPEEFSTIMLKSWKGQSPAALTDSVMALEWLRYYRANQLHKVGAKLNSGWRSCLMPKHGLMTNSSQQHYVVLVPSQWSAIAWKAKQAHQKQTS